MSASTLLAVFDIGTKMLSAFSVLISTPIYISVLLFINANSKKPPFKSPFYTCFTFLGIVDLSCYYLNMLKKFQFWDWTIGFLMPPDQPNFACSIVYFFIWFTSMSQWHLNILISLNRFVSILLPNIYKKYWTINLNRLYISLIFFISFSFTIRILWLPTFIQSIVVVGDNGRNITKLTGPIFINTDDANFYNSIWKIYTYALLCSCILCYIPIYLKIRMLNLTNDTKFQYEINMLYTMVSLLFANILFISFLFIRDYLIDHYKEFSLYSNWFLYILADVYDMHNPYNLLVTSRIVRLNTFPWILRYYLPRQQQIAQANQMMLAAANQNMPPAAAAVIHQGQAGSLPVSNNPQ